MPAMVCDQWRAHKSKRGYRPCEVLELNLSGFGTLPELATRIRLRCLLSAIRHS
jgi:hypothetical protein